MSLAHRLGMVVTIALAIKSGRIPMARAMTLPDIHARQDSAIATSVAPAAGVVPAADATPVLSSVIAAISSPAPVASVAAAPSIASAITSIAAVPTSTPSAIVTSAIVPTSQVASISSVLVSVSANTTSGSSSINSTLTSTPHALATTLAEELESPLPKPNYAPGGMAFILPAFVIVGLIFIIWLIHKTKEYIWKLREAEEAADTQSPDPAAGAPAAAASKLPAPSKAGGGLGGKWRKKGWKELEDQDDTDDDAWAIREKRGVSDKYSRVGEWQGSRKYRSRERGGRGNSRDEGHEHNHEHRDGGERGKYGRLDVHDHDGHEHRRDPERRPSRRPRDHEHNSDRPRPQSRSVRPPSPVPSHAPSRALSRKEKKDRAEEWIRNEKEYTDGRHHTSERRGSHREENGKGKEKERAYDAYEDRYERNYTQHFSLMPPGQAPEKEKGKLDVQIGQTPAFQAAVSGTSVGVATAIISAKTTPEAVTSPTKLLQRTKTSRKPSPETPSSKPAHEDVPAYMRARAVSPPPILSPPLNPNLFFHTGPSTAQLVPLSTYDSATDLESMISAQPTPVPGAGDVGDHGKMPSIPSTADKLERSATAGPGKSVRKVDTPTNSQAVSRTPTRTKSHETPTGGGRTEALRTPVRRGTDGAKAVTPTGRVTPTIRLIDRAGSVRGGETPVLGKTSGLTPKKYSKRLAPTPLTTPESTKRVRAQKKDQKIRGKVDDILRESWSERAVVSPVDAVDDEDEEEIGEEEEVVESSQAVKIMKREVELAQASVSSPLAKPAINTPASPVSTPAKRPSVDPRPVSPRKTGGTIPGVDSEDIRKLQGIDQRMALMKQLEERVKR